MASPLLQNYINTTNRLTGQATPQGTMAAPNTTAPAPSPANAYQNLSRFPSGSSPYSSTTQVKPLGQPQGNPLNGAGGQKPKSGTPIQTGAQPRATIQGGYGPGTGGATTIPSPGAIGGIVGRNQAGNAPNATNAAFGPNMATAGVPPTPWTAAAQGGITAQQQSQLAAHGISQDAWNNLARFPEMQQQLLRQAATTAPPPATPAPFDPTHVTHTIDGQRVVLGQNGQVQMTNGSPTVANAQGQATGNVLDSQGNVVDAAHAPGWQQRASATAARVDPAATSYQDLLNTQYGANNPFGMQSFYGGNPLETAQATAQRAFDENMANINARYAANGLGNSARAGITSGTALADFGTGLADVLATRGQAARDSDANRGLTALMTAGQQNLQGQEISLNANKQLADLGSGMNAIGGLESQIPNMEALLTLLGLFNTTQNKGRTTSDTKTGSGFLGY